MSAVRTCLTSQEGRSVIPHLKASQKCGAFFLILEFKLLDDIGCSNLPDFAGRQVRDQDQFLGTRHKFELSGIKRIKQNKSLII
jgi:hypothetical protein